MIKIRALRPNDLKQVLGLLKRYSEDEVKYSVLQKMQQLYIPLHRFSQLLPLHFQFVPAIFVAVSREKVLGLIWLAKDGKHSRRWKIDQLILDPDSFSYDVGTQLVNYVINRYGGEGVQTFLAFVDQHYNTGLGLLKSCGFRHCTRQHSFYHENPSAIPHQQGDLQSFREATNTDTEKLRDLYNDCLPTEARVSLEKKWHDFYRSLAEDVADKMKGVFFKRWVMEDVARDVLVASIDIATENYKDFYLRLLVNPGWDERYEDVLGLAVNHVLQHTANARIFIDCFEFNKKALETLERLGFSRASAAEVLVKDYWIPIQDKGDRLKSPILLFSGRTSPAVNLRPLPIKPEPVTK